MPRNADIILTPAQRANVATRTRQARPYVGTDTVVTVSYFKRNSDHTELCTLVGKVESVKVNGDHGTVTVVTDKGYRSANLHTVAGITVA